MGAAQRGAGREHSFGLNIRLPFEQRANEVIDGDPKLTFKMDEISEALGRIMTPHLFEISTSTHYGRMVMVDDNTVVIFGNLEEALAYEEYA